MSPGAAGLTNDGQYGFVLCHSLISPQGYSLGIIPACLPAFGALRQHGVAPHGLQCSWAFSPCWKHCSGANHVPCGCNQSASAGQEEQRQKRDCVSRSVPHCLPHKDRSDSQVTKLQLKNNFYFQKFKYWGFAHFSCCFSFWKLD